MKMMNNTRVCPFKEDSSLIKNEWVAKKQKNPQYLVELYKESLRKLVING